MKTLRAIVKEKLNALGPPAGGGVGFDVNVPPENFGDLATNFALKADADPQKIKKKLEDDKELRNLFSKIDVAPNRFINFYYSDEYMRTSLATILEKGGKYGDSTYGGQKKILLEYVSANPTGPLTVANARGSVFGDVLANIMRKTGYRVSREYYINDVGRQMRLLGESVARRYQQLNGKEVALPEDNYQGGYVTDIAREIQDKKLVHSALDDFSGIAREAEAYASQQLTAQIRSALERINVEFDEWFSEKTLHERGKVDGILEMLKKGGFVYEKDGAVWLEIRPKHAAPDAEQKDAVLIKSDGSPTYLLGDIAYSYDKLTERQFDKFINVWGADHHGDVERLRYALTAGLGYKPEQVEILLHQNITLKSGMKMSKRKGQFVTLNELVDEVGADAVRYFFVSKALNTHMEFDLELAKEQSNKNPVYYVQYAHARISSILDKAARSTQHAARSFEAIKEKEEFALIKHMMRLQDLLEDCARRREVHPLTTYATELADAFHRFYEKHRVLADDEKKAAARIALVQAVQTVLRTALDLLGVSAPEKM